MNFGPCRDELANVKHLTVLNVAILDRSLPAPSQDIEPSGGRGDSNWGRDK